jgi:hypothetical protein
MQFILKEISKPLSCYQTTTIQFTPTLTVPPSPADNIVTSQGF